MRAATDISRGQIVEQTPGLVLSPKDSNKIDRTRLGCYVYDVGDGRALLAFGCGSLYNHSPNANARYEVDPENRMLRVTATGNIAAGEEIFINYGDAARPGWNV